MAAAAAGAVSAVAWYGLPALHHSRQSPAARDHAFPAQLDHGRIVALDSTGYLVLSDPSGAHRSRLSALGSTGQRAAAAADGSYLWLADGQVVSVRRNGTASLYPAKLPSISNYVAAAPSAFSDHNRALVTLDGFSGYSSSQNPVSVNFMSTGLSRRLGIADWAAGDPQAPGAFVTVAAPPAASSVNQQVPPDAIAELRDAGRPVQPLATAAVINRDLRQRPATPIAFYLYPNPQGDKVAVVVHPTSGSPQDSGLLLLRRNGRLLGVGATTGMTSNPAWSPSGRQLGFVTADGSQQDLRIWAIGGRTAIRRLPPVTGSYQWCIWSPDNASITCSAAQASTWVVASVTGSVLAPSHGPGFPLIWLPSARAR